jgi:hypothetical protein
MGHGGEQEEDKYDRDKPRAGNRHQYEEPFYIAGFARVVGCRLVAALARRVSRNARRQPRNQPTIDNAP